MELFTTTQVVKAFPEIPQRTLLMWVEKGLCVPFKDAEGRGSRRKYNLANVVTLLTINELSKIGVSHRIIREIINIPVGIWGMYKCRVWQYTSIYVNVKQLRELAEDRLLK